MTPPTTTASSQELLAHAGWVRALARSMVRDAQAAEDVVQETWLAALEDGPRDGASLRAWLATVVRNFARQDTRNKQRRSRREDAVRRADETASTLDVVERAGSQREVVEAVLALDEPYRTTILLRFFDGLPPRAIAQRQRVPVTTVKTRLSRGLQHLRRRLEQQRGGEQGAWLAVVLPLTTPNSSLTGTAIGALIMDTKLKLALAGLLLVGAVSGFVALQDDAQPVAVAANDDVEESEVGVEDLPLAPAPALADTPATKREALLAESTLPQASGSPESAAPTEIARLRGLVLDAEGLAQPGVPLALVSDAGLGGMGFALESIEPGSDPVARSGAGGRFDVVAPAMSGLLVTLDPARATVLAGRHRRGAAGPLPVVVVAPRAPLAGRVTDEGGAPVAEVAIEWSLPAGFRARFDAVLDNAASPSWKTDSDAQGFFEFTATPAVRGARLTARADGFEPWSKPAPELPDAAVEIVLQRPGVDARSVTGRVIDADGDPVEGARVSLGVDTMLSDPQGLFAFDLDEEGTFGGRMGVAPDRLIAVKRGHLPALLDAPEQDDDGAPRWPSQVVLRLGSEPLAIAGRVVHQDGSPAEGSGVWVADPLLLGAVDGRPTMVEGLLAGAEDSLWSRVATDAEGRFLIEGLMDRSYRVEAMDPATLLRVGLDDVAAGTERLELVLPDDQLIERIAGRVVSRHGVPVPSAAVFPMCDAFRVRHRESTLGTRHATLDGVRTDEEGRFELANVPQTLVYLRVNGDRTLPVEYGRHTEGGIQELANGRMTELEIIVPLRCHVKVELEAGHLANEVAVLDEAGERLTLNVIQGTGRRETETIELSEGQSPPLAVSDAGVTLVLLQAGVELERVPLALTPDELNVVP